jgi:hypothetical protein
MLSKPCSTAGPYVYTGPRESLVAIEDGLAMGGAKVGSDGDGSSDGSSGDDDGSSGDDHGSSGDGEGSSDGGAPSSAAASPAAKRRAAGTNGGARPRQVPVRVGLQAIGGNYILS